MHRLLVNKGYIFPEIKVEDAAVLNPSDNLKSLEDLQKEEAVVHSAKLQELIRRGKPLDLQEANKLMKIMAGFKEDNVEENKKQIKDDIARLRRKVEILGQMLNSIESSNGKIDDSNEAVLELYSSVKSSQPNITKIIEEENDNEENVRELLNFNESINDVINKFQLLKDGKLDQASQIKVSGTSGANDNDLNLIDFDDDAPISNDQTGRDDKGYNDLLSDLSNLAFTDTSSNNLFGSGGSIALGGAGAQVAGQSTIQQPEPQIGSTNSSSRYDLLSGLQSPSPQLQSNAPNQLDPFGFNFPTSTPSQIQGGTNQIKSTILINQSPNLKIEIGVFSTSTKKLFNGKVIFSNPLPSSLTNFKFLLAVPKSCKLNLKPQSGDSLYGFSNQGINQEFSIENNLDKQLKVKWKVEYKIGNEPKEETGVAVLSDE
ncbi:uncharacterized protein PRCAT00000661001 [Priceomyces carsonii]|uniref:uncharacterized protein n=1 Tax=Priceomyces carsonii TaxID=28549 RepID=UPI002ED831E0|nr:unnamed protein product [Priceomyces carsonii]